MEGQRRGRRPLRHGCRAGFPSSAGGAMIFADLVAGDAVFVDSNGCGKVSGWLVHKPQAPARGAATPRWRLQGKVDPPDVVKEAFLEAHREFQQFRGQTEAELLAWLRRVLAASLADQVRRPFCYNLLLESASLEIGE